MLLKKVLNANVMKNNVCKRICKLSNEQICIGCGRKWEEIRDWYLYTKEEKEKIIEKLKNFKTFNSSKFDQSSR